MFDNGSQLLPPTPFGTLIPSKQGGEEEKLALNLGSLPEVSRNLVGVSSYCIDRMKTSPFQLPLEMFWKASAPPVH